ncbi:hypothetical protein SAMN04487894_10910 [Niabella drilacis]|uniref:Uncharacterized protein n=1 Tax=Niabella drilacis (strain DSM 25811 / CCM 8410 / CCUG 62505 / LMG 26954 / E90) TaxID=1285928 RepID=A0A1G6UK14_NIADE|nr:hypothetical protein SAMN04487894_10910 [Niabella drilacis]
MCLRIVPNMFPFSQSTMIVILQLKFRKQYFGYHLGINSDIKIEEGVENQ